LIYVFSFLFIILFSFSYLKFSYGLEIINEEKVSSPEIIKIQKYPKYPTTNSELRIYVSVIDKFGQIVNSTLSYSFDKGNSHNHIPMELVNGISSNGTYLGIIKPNSKNAENTILQYKLYFEDNLGYHHNSGYEQLKFEEPDLTSPVLWDDPKVSICPPEKIKNLESTLISYADDINGFNIDNNCFILYENMSRPESPLLFYIGIMENNTGVKNATLFYSTDLRSTEKYMSKDLIIVRSPSQFNVYYAIGTFPSLNYDANLAYYIETYDFAGNKDTSKNYTLTFINSNPSPGKSILDNETTANLEIKQIDNRNLEVEARIDIEIGEDTIFSSYDNLFEPRRTSIMVLSVNNNFDGFVNGFENSTFVDEDNIYLDSSEGIVSTFYPAKASGSLKLIGDRSLYPFDKYYVNLVIIIPVGNAALEDGAIINDEIKWGVVTLDNQVKSSWDGVNSEITTINSNNNAMGMHGLDSLYLCDNQMIFDNDESTLSYCGVRSHNDQSFLNVRIDLARNYLISIIVIPLFSIFFLLGAIFIFENSLDNIGNRLTLTFGIFALLFTLPEIIDSMKPQTSAPTIADSMLSIIIIATIAFTISSIISSSSTIQKWFPKHHTWIDGIVFVIVSIFVITYFNKYLLYSQLWWLVPIILFGLGYGLLLRVLGIKINKPLLHFFKVTKKRNV
jgi:hypothetical protein